MQVKSWEYYEQNNQCLWADWVSGLDYYYYIDILRGILKQKCLRSHLRKDIMLNNIQENDTQMNLSKNIELFATEYTSDIKRIFVHIF